MKKSFIRVVSICIALMMITSFAGCNQNEKNSTETSAATTSTGNTEKDYTSLLGSVDDSSDLPDWTGKQLKLVQWFGFGKGEADHDMAEKDVVSPEIKRVTGVELDKEKSFDNGGNSPEVKLALLSAAGDWPDLIMIDAPEQFKQMIMADKLYDLSDLMGKYCPDVMKKFDTEKYPRVMQKITADDTGISKRIFFAPLQAGANFARQMADDSPEFDSAKWANMQLPRPETDWTRIWVRDDILKKMYPNAMTQDEIEALFAKNGTFTKEQIFDVPIKSSDDFIKFMTDMKALIEKENIKVDNKPVEVTYAANASDNWALMACLMPMIYGQANLNYFTYYDRLAGNVQYSFKQDFFKKEVSAFQKLVANGVISKESLLDNNTIFNEKLNTGRYAITYAWNKPDEKVLKEAGQKFRYRQLWPDIEYNYNQFVAIESSPAPQLFLGIFKDSVSEEDLPQILGYINYMVSDIGEKLVSWGPKSAGLWTEENGKRVFTDKELEANMAYGADNKRNIYYGLYNYFVATSTNRQPWPYYALSADAHMNHPKYIYAGAPKDVGQTDSYFQPGILPGEAREDNVVSAFKSDYMPEYATQWEVVTKGRDAFEKALTATLAAKDEEQFNKLYQAMIDTAASIGMDDKMLEEINKIFKDQNPTFDEDAAKAFK